MSTFQHQPLTNSSSEIRLLYLHAGSGDDPVVCTLEHYQQPRQGYEALSYAWGDETDYSLLQLNGKPFLIKKKLHTALRHLRNGIDQNESKSGTARLFWIDAICIDQSNVEERNEQVQRMRSIYEGAVRVVVWLGADHELEDDEVSFTPSIWSFGKLPPGSIKTTNGALALAIHLALYETVGGGFDEDQKSWGYLCRLLSRSWFSRLWILQEIAASQSVVCTVGRSMITWNTLEKAAIHILDPEFVKEVPCPYILPLMRANNVLKVGLRGADPWNLLTILREVQDAQCTDPRDKIFALKGLLLQDEAEDIEIDYSKSIKRVYADWAWKRIDRLQSLDIFSICADSAGSSIPGLYSANESEGIPSWTPDLRKALGRDNPLFKRSHSGQLPRGIYNRPFLVTRSDDGLKLSMVGARSDKVAMLTSIGDPTQSLVNPISLSSSLLAIIEDWERLILRHFRPERMDKAAQLSKTFTRTLLRGYHAWGKDRKGAWLRQRYEVWRGLLEVPKDFSPPVEIDGSDLDRVRNEFVGDIERILFTMTHGCQMLITQHGDLGVVAGNCHVAAGDEIWVLPRGLTPFILRHVEDSSYRLMGPCYIDGMDEQATEKTEWREKMWTNLTLI